MRALERGREKTVQEKIAWLEDWSPGQPLMLVEAAKEIVPTMTAKYGPARDGIGGHSGSTRNGGGGFSGFRSASRGTSGLPAKRARFQGAFV